MTLIAILVPMLLCCAAMSSLSLAMDRHYEQLTGQREVPFAQRRIFRVMGWVLLLLSASVSIGIWETGLGLVFWCGFLTAAALSIACGMTYLPRITVTMAGLGLPLALLGLAILWMLKI